LAHDGRCRRGHFGIAAGGTEDRHEQPELIRVSVRVVEVRLANHSATWHRDEQRDFPSHRSEQVADVIVNEIENLRESAGCVGAELIM
jgi:hypothetical protein